MDQPQQSLSMEHRKELLGRAVAQEVSRGARLESRLDAMAVLVVGQKVNHILHLLIVVFTCGLWVVAWFIVAQSGGERRYTLSIDEAGQLLVDGRLPQPRAEAPRQPDSVVPQASGIVGFVTRNPVPSFLLGVIAVGVVAAVVASAVAPSRRAHMQEAALLAAASFLPSEVAGFQRTAITEANTGKSATATYVFPGRVGLTVEAQATWQGPEYDSLMASGGEPLTLAGRTAYRVVPTGYDEIKIRWAERGWHCYAMLTFPRNVPRPEAEQLARDVTSALMAQSARLATTKQ